MGKRGAGRRRSTSEGEGDRLSSTLNLPEATRFNQFENINSNRYASTPQIDVTGFIDDNIESVLDRGLFQMLLM